VSSGTFDQWARGSSKDNCRGRRFLRFMETSDDVVETNQHRRRMAAAAKLHNPLACSNLASSRRLAKEQRGSGPTVNEAT
jgi:hypothetical protein